MIFRPYNRLEAVIYAHRWAYSRNPSFYDYEELGGDCTNFASQCIYAGTGIMNFTPTYGWYYIDPDDKAPAWTGVEYLRNFLVRPERSPGPVAQETRSSTRRWWYSPVQTAIQRRSCWPLTATMWTGGRWIPTPFRRTGCCTYWVHIRHKKPRRSLLLRGLILNFPFHFNV